MFIEILFKILLFKGGILIYADHCKSGQVRSMDSAKYVTQHKIIYINKGKKII